MPDSGVFRWVGWAALVLKQVDEAALNAAEASDIVNPLYFRTVVFGCICALDMKFGRYVFRAGTLYVDLPRMVLLVRCEFGLFRRKVAERQRPHCDARRLEHGE